MCVCVCAETLSAVVTSLKEKFIEHFTNSYNSRPFITAYHFSFLFSLCLWVCVRVLYLYFFLFLVPRPFNSQAQKKRKKKNASVYLSRRRPCRELIKHGFKQVDRRVLRHTVRTRGTNYFPHSQHNSTAHTHTHDTYLNHLFLTPVACLHSFLSVARKKKKKTNKKTINDRKRQERYVFSGTSYARECELTITSEAYNSLCFTAAARQKEVIHVVVVVVVVAAHHGSRQAGRQARAACYYYGRFLSTGIDVDVDSR